MQKIVIGSILLLISFIFDFFPTNHTSIILIYACVFCLGLFYLYDGIVTKMKGASYIHIKPKKVIRHILIVGIATGIITEALGNWLYKFWVYPHLPTYFYLLIVPIALGLYFFLLFENYIAVHLVLEKFLPKKQVEKIQRKKIYTIIFSTIGFIGVALFTFVSFNKLLLYKLPKNILDIFNTYWRSSNDLFTLFALCISIWFIFEYLEYQRSEDTLFTHVIKGDFIALISIVIASFFTSIVMEVFNLPLHIWTYTNVPYANVVFLGVPIVIIALWPFQYLLFECFYHFIYKKETAAIWSE